MSGRWGLRHLAGSSNGDSGHVDGVGGAARFSTPLDLVLSADERTLYIADRFNQAIRALDLDTLEVTTVVRTIDVDRWDSPGATASGFPSNLSINPAGDQLLVTHGYYYDGTSPIIEIDLTTGVAEACLTTGGFLGGIAHDPDGATATVKAHLYEPSTGWQTLTLAGANRGTLAEPPTLPDPPYCDPPTNSIPVQVAYVRDVDNAANSAVATVGSIVVAFRAVDGNVWPPFTDVIAFDPWNLSAFPGPYTSCTDLDAPAYVQATMSDTTATPFVPQSTTRGPDLDTGMPTIVAATNSSPNGLLLQVAVDETGQQIHLSVPRYRGVENQSVDGVAYSPSRDRYYFTIANIRDDGQKRPNQIVELVPVRSKPTYMGGTGAVPIASGTGAGEQPVVLVTEDGDTIVDDTGNDLIWG